METGPLRRRIAIVGLTGGLVAGGALAGAALGTPITSGAQSDDPATTQTTDPAAADQGTAPTPPADAPDHEQHLRDALQPLLDDGTLDQSQVDAVVAALQAARPDGPMEGMGGHRGGRGPGLDAAAEAIGIDADELRQALQDGSTVADVAAANGVDVQTVVDAMVADLRAHLDEEVASGEHTQEEADAMIADATDRITAMVNGEMPAMGDGPMGHHGGPFDGDSSSSDTDSSTD